MKKIFISGLIILSILIVILFFVFKSSNKALSILSVSVSGLAVILAIIFEGELKLKTKNIKGIRLTGIGIFLLILYTLSTIANGIISVQSINESETKAKSDSITSANIITSLKKQRSDDSIHIISLNRQIASIDTTLVLNTIKELEEQRKAVERGKENTFQQLQSEILSNLEKTIFNYEEKVIKGFKDTDLFIYTRFSSEYINKYKLISSSKSIISYFMKTSELIKKVNTYADLLVGDKNKKSRQTNINMLLKNLQVLFEYLSNINERIINLDSYKQYESIDFSKPIPKVNREDLQNYFIQRDLMETNKSDATN